MKAVGHKPDRNGQSDGRGEAEAQVHSQRDDCLAREVQVCGYPEDGGLRMRRGSIRGACILLVLPVEGRSAALPWPCASAGSKATRTLSCFPTSAASF